MTQQTSVLTKKQVRTIGPKIYTEQDGTEYRITAELRYDDQCNNGHNTFGITGSIDRKERGRWTDDSGGCIHDAIAEHFPSLQPLIKWHGCTSDGPIHFGNAVYYASERDCWGTLKGEPRPNSVETFIVFGDNPIRHQKKASFAKWLREHSTQAGPGALYDFEVIAYHHDDRPGETHKYAPKYTFGGYALKWHECPFDSEEAALQFLYALQHCDPRYIQRPTSFGEGKARDLAAARSCAIWPDATDEDLTAPGLKDRLAARLPALLVEFRAAMEGVGFTW